MTSVVHTVAAGLSVEPTVAAGERSSRVVVLDVLRGIALLGMYVVHFGYGLGEGPGVEMTHSVIAGLFDGRFHAMFGILFGVGFAVMLGGAEARGERFVPRFLRRLAMLLVFGVIAHVGFGYNVLVSYALWGVPLLLVRNWSVRALLIATVVAIMSQSIFVVFQAGVAQATGTSQAWREARLAEMQEGRARGEALQKGEAAESWPEVVAARARHVPYFYTRPFSWLPSINFSLFLIGLLAWRLGVFQQPGAHRRLIFGAMAFGVAVALMGEFVFTWPFRRPAPDEAILPWTIVSQAKRVGFLLLDPRYLTFTYIGAVLLVAARGAGALRRFAPFAWAGRLALTNYMTQVILLDVLTSNYGLGLKFPVFMVPVGALALFGAQAALSRWWLSRYRYGPCEWLWRCVTCWRVESNRIDAPAAAPLATAA